MDAQRRKEAAVTPDSGCDAARDALGEIGLVQAQTQREARHQPMPQSGECVHVGQHHLAKARWFGRKQVRAVQGRAGADERMVGGQFRAEV